MSVFLFALALLTAADPDAAEPAQTAPPEVAPAAAEAAPPPNRPVGAPTDEYGLVAWCYGALSGYLDLHDQAMPEVTRIESTWRRPGSNLKEDLQVYSDMQKAGRSNLKLFAGAMEAAEKASLRPINARGAEAIKRGRNTWAAAATLPKARVAQEWMSWSLPDVCITTAKRLQTSATLMGATFDASQGLDAAEAEPQAASPAPETASEPAPEPAGDSLSIDRLLESSSAGAVGTADSAAEASAPPNP